MVRKWVGYAAGGLIVSAILIQLVPYGHAHTNPPVRQEPAWDTPQTRELAVRACYDCHSNESVWPWYSNIAPFSWLVQSHVDGARHRLNFSAFDRPQKHAKHAHSELTEGGMPPWYYPPLHGKARLTDAEQKQLGDGFLATFGPDEDEEEGEEE